MKPTTTCENTCADVKIGVEGSPEYRGFTRCVP